jgi:hypothetical protein
MEFFAFLVGEFLVVLLVPLFLVRVLTEMSRDVSTVLSVFELLLLNDLCDLAALFVFSHKIIGFLSPCGPGVAVGVADGACV